jgi:hypothetical protein
MKLDVYLSEVRRGLEPCPSDQDILEALRSLPLGSPLEAVRTRAVELSLPRLERRRVVAERQRRKRIAKLGRIWP